VFAGMLPLWFIFFERMVYAEPGHLTIPFAEIFALFTSAIFATLTGFVFRRRYPRAYFQFWNYLPLFTLTTVALFLAVEIYSHHYLFRLVTATMFIYVTVLVACGYGLGALIPYLARQKASRILNICLETGSRTTIVVGHILVGSLSAPDGDIALTAAMLYVITCLLPIVLAATVYRIIFKYRLSLYAETECKIVSKGMIDDMEELCNNSDILPSTETTM